MNGKTSYWTVRVAGGWGVKQQGVRQTSSVHELQQDAWREARRLTGGKQDGPRFAALTREAPARRTGIRDRAAGPTAGTTAGSAGLTVSRGPRRGPLAA
jgi:hypothetical protein